MKSHKCKKLSLNVEKRITKRKILSRYGWHWHISIWLTGVWKGAIGVLHRRGWGMPSRSRCSSIEQQFFHLINFYSSHMCKFSPFLIFFNKMFNLLISSLKKRFHQIFTFFLCLLIITN